MKRISRLKLTKLSKSELSKREQNHLIGGERCCTCGCLTGSPYGTLDVGNSAYIGYGSGYGFYYS